MERFETACAKLDGTVDELEAPRIR